MTKNNMFEFWKQSLCKIRARMSMKTTSLDLANLGASCIGDAPHFFGFCLCISNFFLVWNQSDKHISKFDAKLFNLFWWNAYYVVVENQVMKIDVSVTERWKEFNDYVCGDSKCMYILCGIWRDWWLIYCLDETKIIGFLFVVKNVSPQLTLNC